MWLICRITITYESDSYRFHFDWILKSCSPILKPLPAIRIFTLAAFPHVDSIVSRQPDTPGRSGILVVGRVLALSPGVAGDGIWWEAGRVRFVGPAVEAVRRAPSGTPLFELPGAWVTPGFVDAHTHFAAWALGRRRV